MAGTREGGRRAAAKNLANDPHFYSKIGRKGGMAPSAPKGFAYLKEVDPDKHLAASTKGGNISRRKKANA